MASFNLESPPRRRSLQPSPSSSVEDLVFEYLQSQVPIVSPEPAESISPPSPSKSKSSPPKSGGRFKSQTTGRVVACNKGLTYGKGSSKYPSRKFAKFSSEKQLLHQLILYPC